MDHMINHTVLVVDDEKTVGKLIQKLLNQINVKTIYASNGNDGLGLIKNRAQPFSIIISDQIMPSMKGHEFLEKAKSLSPDTLRFLITGHSDIEAIIDAVNKGAIHKYIAKPFEPARFVEAVKSGLKNYELFLENEQLLEVAKNNNNKLFTINRDLRQKVEQHNEKLAALNKKIDSVKTEIEAVKNQDSVQDIKSGKKAEQQIKNQGLMNYEKLSELYNETIHELYEQFREVAVRNGIDISEFFEGGSNA